MQIVNMVSTATMSSREIADLIEKQHSHIKVSAERLAEKGVIGTLATREFTHNGNVYTEYLLNKRDSLILVAQNCPEFTARIVDRWQELEDKQSAPASPLHNAVSVLSLLHTTLSAVPGINQNIAAAAFFTCVEQNTGLKTEALRLALPRSTGPLDSLNATNLGKRLGFKAQATNALLCEHGYQVRNDRGDYELTELGANYGSAAPFATGKHSGYQILWSERTVEALARAIGIKL